MTTHVIDKLNAVSVINKGPVHIPTHFSPNILVKTLERLLPVPASISAAASKGQPLKESRHRFTVPQIDAVLSERGVGITDRIRLKAAMSQNGLL